MSAEIAKNITKSSGSNFYYSFNFLPSEKRKAIYVIYAFCRETDNIVDSNLPEPEKRKALIDWQKELNVSLNGNASIPLLNNLGETARQFNIPPKYFNELIAGVEMDLEKNRYASFDELYTYCYRVASTVGLMCAEIFSYTKEITKQYAVNLGIALQLTNIIRDVKSDIARDRIYIPDEDMKKYSYTEIDLKNHVYDKRFIMLMRHQAARARSFYHEANLKLPEEDRQQFLAARIMGNVYYAILRKIERKRFNVFHNNVRLNRLRQLGIALGGWMKYKVLQVG